MKTIFLMVFVLVSPSQANLWGSNTESWLVGEQHQTACRAAGETVAVAQRRLWSPGTAYKLPWAWMGSTDWWILGKKMVPQFLLVFTVSLLWIHLWCGHIWVICWFCHTGSTWNSSLEFSVMTVSLWAAHAGHAHVPLLCRTQHEAAQVWLYCQMLFSLLSLHLLTLLSSFTAQALNKH